MSNTPNPALCAFPGCGIVEGALIHECPHNYTHPSMVYCHPFQAPVETLTRSGLPPRGLVKESARSRRIAEKIEGHSLIAPAPVESQDDDGYGKCEKCGCLMTQVRLNGRFIYECTAQICRNRQEIPPVESQPPVEPLSKNMRYAARRIEEFNNNDFAAEYLREAADLIESQDQEIERLRAIEQPRIEITDEMVERGAKAYFEDGFEPNVGFDVVEERERTYCRDKARLVLEAALNGGPNAN